MALSNLTQTIGDVCKDAGKVLTTNASPICVGIGLLALGTAVVVACIESPKAKEKIDETHDALEELNEDLEDNYISEEEYKEEKKELYVDLTKELLRRFVPIILLVASGIFCILYSHKLNANKIAGLTTAYQISETSRKAYEDKVRETIGEKKEQKIHDSINQDRLLETEYKDAEIKTLESTKPDQLCFDAMSGRYFRCSVDRIKSAVNALNEKMMHNHTQTASLNDYYDILGLDRIKMGDLLEWNIDDGLVEIRESSGLTANSEPCYIVDFYKAPQYAV